MMLAIRELHFSSLHQAKAPKEVKFIEQAIINAQKSLVAASLHQALMKTEIERVIAIEIFGFGCGIHRFDQGLQFRDLGAGKPTSGSTSGKFLQRRVDIMDFDRLVQIDLAHEGPAILFDLNQTKIFQGAKRFSNRTTANPEA